MAPRLLLLDNMNEPVSRTYQYRKVMKPLLERKRRARINRCLDELKELMTSTLAETEGDNAAKLEKADILELTVRHLQQLRRQNRLFVNTNVAYMDRFRAGFTHCANEVSHFLSRVDHNAGQHLVRHLRDCMQRCEPPGPPPPPAPPVLPMEPLNFTKSGLAPPSPPPGKAMVDPQGEDVWRPWG